MSLEKTMEIVLGRDTRDARLHLTIDGKEQSVGTPGSVPQTVAPQHCKLTIANGHIRLINMDINHYTYVNGQSVESKAVESNAKIELGQDRYLLDWSLLNSVIPVDITPLKQVWDDYEQGNVNLQVDERRFNALRSATGVITMAAIALSIATGGRNIWYILLYGLAILISLLSFVKAYRDASKVPQRRLELARRFQRTYVCPRCGHFMGNQPYELLAQNPQCPYCKTQFIL